LDAGTSFDSAELYDPTTGTFSDCGSMTTARQARPVIYGATLLSDGRVLIAGGTGSFPSGPLASAEVYTP